MEQTLSGYCRTIDAARIVWCEKEDEIWEADCDYAQCPHKASCEIGKAITALTEERA